MQNNLRLRLTPLVLLTCMLLPLTSGADERRGERRDVRRGQSESHEFREREFRDRGFLDGRFNHDHYYPLLGYRFGRLPPEHHSVVFGSARYFFAAGIWYSFLGGEYVVVAPPIGITTPVLPPYSTTVWLAGVPYYYANRVYYAQSPQGYVVVPEPVGAAMTSPPPNASPATSNGVIELGPITPSPQPKPPPPPSSANAGTGAQLYIYPRQGQSVEQQAKDRGECHDWTLKQIGGDRSIQSNAQSLERSPDYSRAIGACLEARGYTVR
jgi:hypothetical protein